MSYPAYATVFVPSGAVSNGLYDVIRGVSAVFPFRATLDALESAVGGSGGVGVPLLHLLALSVAWVVVARVALRRFA